MPYGIHKVDVRASQTERGVRVQTRRVFNSKKYKLSIMSLDRLQLADKDSEL